jgi:acetyltransferase-like isoleucine patch superfamily enzyme
MDERLRRIKKRMNSAPLMAHLRGAWLRRKFTCAGLLIAGRSVTVINRGGEIVVENCSFFSGVRLECLPGGRIFISSGTYLNRNTEIIAGAQTHIGRDCKITWDVVIMDTDQHGIGDQSAIAPPVWIGDRVWVGCRAIILKGVTIGDDAVIGAGAIVTRDVPPRAIVTGPAADVRGCAQQSAPAVEGDLMRRPNEPSRANPPTSSYISRSTANNSRGRCTRTWPVAAHSHDSRAGIWRRTR